MGMGGRGDSSSRRGRRYPKGNEDGIVVSIHRLGRTAARLATPSRVRQVVLPTPVASAVRLVCGVRHPGPVPSIAGNEIRRRRRSPARRGSIEIVKQPPPPPRPRYYFQMLDREMGLAGLPLSGRLITLSTVCCLSSSRALTHLQDTLTYIGVATQQAVDFCPPVTPTTPLSSLKYVHTRTAKSRR
jgi:hypothetical protein